MPSPLRLEYEHGTWDVVEHWPDYPRVKCVSRSKATALRFMYLYDLYLSGVMERPNGFSREFE